MNKTRHLSQTLHEANVALNGTLIQLDHLQELIGRVNMPDKRRQAINQQIHRLTVNNASVRDSLNIIPRCGRVD
ncbi:hypothetical protein D8911_12035 [Levilactobacillus brevis]|nr:hypothetical protein D8911_12035 [Levilactobacillus brevis]